jgi:tetratricopeptide (TPR) repeat protein
MKSKALAASVTACLLLITGCTRQVAEIFRFKAETENKKGDYKAAIADCDHAALLDPRLVRVHYLRGFAKYNLKDWEGAIYDFDTEIKIAPHNAAGYFGRGLVEGLEGSRLNK